MREHHGPRHTLGARVCAGLLVIAVCGSAAAQSMGSPFANDDPQQHIAREMVEVLKAYAAYKSGDYEDAFARYQTLADKGSVPGMLNLANMYAAGEGTQRDEAEALKWYKRAADTGDANAMYQVGTAYEKGLGTPADSSAAQQWYRRSAEAGNAEAQWTLGQRLFRRGDKQAALKWIRKAAEDGNDPDAQAFIAAHEPTDDTPTGQPSAAQIQAILETMTAIDEAATARNAAGIVAHIDADAEISVSLPGGPGWTDLSRAEFKTLWQDSFERADEYHYQRSSPDMLSADNGVQVYSQIDERFGSSGEATRLQISEDALFRIEDGVATIHRLRLDIRRAR